MWKGVLPIGSIVLLKGGERRLMIIGNCISREDDDSRVYDYAGTLYPDGFEDPDSLYMFNAENIERVYYVGYMDEDSRKFLAQMETVTKELRSN
jgi:hypothetical protein